MVDMFLLKEEGMVDLIWTYWLGEGEGQGKEDYENFIGNRKGGVVEVEGKIMCPGTDATIMTHGSISAQLQLTNSL